MANSKPMRIQDRNWNNHKGEAFRVTIDLDPDKLAKSKTLSMIVNRAASHPKGKATGFYGSVTVQVTPIAKATGK